MSRKLTDEDRALWDRLSQSVRPLRRSHAQSDAAATELAIESQKKPVPGRPQAPVSPPPARPQPALAPLEERTRRRLARGLVEVDARIDLHGMRQERAFNALVAFLRKAQTRGDRFVLVVTGKGRASEEGRGILRESVPAWLARPDLRNLIVGWEQASRRHGGAGALYVRVRRRREGRSS